MFRHIGSVQKKWLLPLFIALTAFGVSFSLLGLFYGWVYLPWSIGLAVLAGFATVVLVVSKRLVSVDDLGNIIVPSFTSLPVLSHELSQPCFYWEIVPDDANYPVYLFRAEHVARIERADVPLLFGRVDYRAKVTFKTLPVLLKNVKSGSPQFDTATQSSLEVTIEVGDWKKFLNLVDPQGKKLQASAAR